jgi:hypothetical protein
MDDKNEGVRKHHRPPPPMTIDEIIERDNIPAETAAPPEVVAQLSTPKVFLSDTHLSPAELKRSIEVHEDGGGALQLSLPPGSFVGQAGRAGHRVAVKALPATSEHQGQAFKPDWAPLIFHPKLGAMKRPRRLRGPGGRRTVTPANQSWIYGTDDRVLLHPKGYPWQCIGKVDVYPNANADYPTSSGSGVLIGDRLVLTAGHVPPVNPRPGTWKMRFTASLYNGFPVEGPGAVSYVSDFQGYLGGVSATDYAVLRLYEPLGTSLGFFGWKTYDRSWTGGDYWWLAGYPFDIGFGQSPSFQRGIPVLDQDSDNGGLELEHHGDIASGDSGGPFWGFWDDNFPYVVGTVSGNEVIFGPSWAGGEDNNISAGGGALSDLLAWARSNWP